jgi:hypothetical protein
MPYAVGLVDCLSGLQQVAVFSCHNLSVRVGDAVKQAGCIHPPHVCYAKEQLRRRRLGGQQKITRMKMCRAYLMTLHLMTSLGLRAVSLTTRRPIRKRHGVELPGKLSMRSTAACWLKAA